MKQTTAVLVVLLAFALASCVLRGKPKAASATPPAPKPAVTPAPPPPSPPLSIHQTQVDLPSPQAVSPDALATAPPEQPVETPPAQRPRRPAPSPAPARAESQPPPDQTPAQPPAAEPERPPVQAIVPAGDLKRLQDSAQARRREARQALAQAQTRRLNQQEQDLIKRIDSFLTQSDQAEARGDMRQADALAERAQVLARGLAGGR